MSTVSRTVRNGSTPVDCRTMPICWRIDSCRSRGVEPEHPDVARRALPVSLEDLGGRGLAGAVRAEEREHLTPVDVQVDAGAPPRRRRRTCGVRATSITRSDTPDTLSTDPEPGGRVDPVPQRLAAREPRGVVDEDARRPPPPTPRRPRTCAGRARTCGIAHNGLSAGSGSSTNTSRPAPAIPPRSSASIERGLVDRGATADVVEPGGRPHRRERGRVEELAGGRRQRERVEHVVGARRARRGTPRRRRSRRPRRRARPGARRARPPRPPSRARARARPSRGRSGPDRRRGAGSPRGARASCRPRHPFASAGRAGRGSAPRTRASRRSPIRRSRRRRRRARS